MTPKEKAEDLFMIYVNKGMSQIKPVINRVIRKEMAKQCALIAVDEIIKETPQLTPEETFIDGSCGVDYFINDRFEYWQKVKTEIKKL